MKSTISRTLVIMCLVFSCIAGTVGCEKSDRDMENVSTTEFINYNCSYGNNFAVFVEHDDTYGVNKIKYYNPQNNSYTYACGRANCDHGCSDYQKSDCNAVFIGDVNFAFIYNDDLYYFTGESNMAFYRSNVDGTNKKKITDVDFDIDSESAVVKSDRIYCVGCSEKYGEEDANGVSTIEKAEAEVYSIDLKNGKVDKLTDFGEKADANVRAMKLVGNKLIFNYFCQNKSIYNSEFKSYADYTDWLSTEKNSYSKAIDIFDQKCEYYSIDLDTNKLRKLKFNYECNYEGINKEKAKEFCDFFILGKAGDYYYMSIQYGAGYSLYQYDINTDKMQKIGNSYRMYFCQSGEKIYWVETDYDKNKQLGGFDSEDYSAEPGYKECDMKTGKITDWKINYDLKGKLIRPQCICENYIYGFISEFADTNKEDDEQLIAIKR